MSDESSIHADPTPEPSSSPSASSGEPGEPQAAATPGEAAPEVSMPYGIAAASGPSATGGAIPQAVAAAADVGKSAEPGPVTPLDHADLAHALEATQSALIDSAARCQAVYAERNRCVAALARAALGFGLRAWLGKHPAEETAPPVATWDPDWSTIVYILLPAGLVSWHLHDSEVPAFAFLVDQVEAAPYDGHTTPEKYARLSAWEPRR